MLALSLMGVGRESVLPHDCAIMAPAAGAHVSPAPTGDPQAAHAHAGHAHAEDAHAGHAHTAPARAVHGHEATPDAPSDDAPPGHSSDTHDCQCIGDCCGTPLAPLASRRPAVPAPHVVWRATTHAGRATHDLPTAPRHRQPYPLGPPTAALA